VYTQLWGNKMTKYLLIYIVHLKLFLSRETIESCAYGELRESRHVSS